MVWRKIQLGHDDGELFTAGPRLDRFLDSQRHRDAAIIAAELTEWAIATYSFARDQRGEDLPRESVFQILAELIREWPPFKDLGIQVDQRTRCARLLSRVVIDQAWDSISKKAGR